MDTKDYQTASKKLNELSRVMKLYKEIVRVSKIEVPPLQTTGKKVCEFIRDMDIFAYKKTSLQIWSKSQKFEPKPLMPYWYGFAIEKRNTYRRYLGL